MLAAAINAPVGMTALVRQQLMGQWCERQTQIIPSEAVCAVGAFWHLREHLYDQDVNYFVDSQSAVEALIKGTCSASDVADIANVAHLLWLLLRTRVWIEWVDSDSNPSDGLSRDGLSDAWTTQQGWALSEVEFPEALCCRQQGVSLWDQVLAAFASS